MEAYRDVFLAESADFLQQVVDGLLKLESAPHDLGPVEDVFRGAHSLKGMSAAMGYTKSADLTHKMEGLMDRVRKSELPVTSELVNLLLGAVDLVKMLIDDESKGKDEVDPSEMIAAIDELKARALSPDMPAEAVAQPPVASAAKDGTPSWLASVTLEESCVLKAVRAYMVIKRFAHMGEVVETHPTAQEIEDERFHLTFEVVVRTVSDAEQIKEAALQVSEVASVEVSPVEERREPALPEGPSPVSESPLSRTRELPKLSQTQTVRVSIGHLDTLVDLVGELVILRSRLEEIQDRSDDVELREALDEFQRISTDLQYEVMQTRMVPVGNIFNRFPRMVRDLAADLGKRVDFKMDGLDIELDRTVLDEIGDPLVHLLRNSIDHGICTAEERVAAGKPAVGTITLSASRERDHVAIVVSDDGRGLDVERVWRKAVERGVVSDEDRSVYDDSEIFQFTCLPGFTTAETATRVSGRGVGMDVVKGKIEHLGGTLQIRSEFGRGSDFVLRLPLTLAIVQALIVEARGQAFALPLSSVEEVFGGDEVNVETVDGSPVMILRDGALVPLMRLDSLLFGGDPSTLPTPNSSIVLVNTGAGHRALQVDDLGGRQEIVAKPLSRLFRDQNFSGATILGDGRVMLILDPRVLAATEVQE